MIIQSKMSCNTCLYTPSTCLRRFMTHTTGSTFLFTTTILFLKLAMQSVLRYTVDLAPWTLQLAVMALRVKLLARQTWLGYTARSMSTNTVRTNVIVWMTIADVIFFLTGLSWISEVSSRWKALQRHYAVFSLCMKDIHSILLPLSFLPSLLVSWTSPY